MIFRKADRRRRVYDVVKWGSPHVGLFHVSSAFGAGPGNRIGTVA